MLVDEARVDKAMAILAETDLEVASWRGQVLRTEFMAKSAEALAFKSLEGTVEDRKQGARLEKAVQDAWEQHFKAVVGWESCKARREREVMVVELFRTLESSRRAGNLR
jgi:hypothetical protein